MAKLISVKTHEDMLTIKRVHLKWIKKHRNHSHFNIKYGDRISRKFNTFGSRKKRADSLGMEYYYKISGEVLYTMVLKYFLDINQEG